MRRMKMNDLHVKGAKDDSNKTNYSYLFHFHDAICKIGIDLLVREDEHLDKEWFNYAGYMQDDDYLTCLRMLLKSAGTVPTYQINHFSRAIATYKTGFRGICNIAEVGELKYTFGGWKSVPDAERRYRGAHSRHYLDRTVDGEYLSEDLKLPHSFHEMWNLLALIQLQCR
jgi:hypothetical protein